ncbi:YdeI/OmpD-associated family protein [Pseudooctadecabacter jejudonensis]|uniref:Bacteriocin-protection, YdeI or OmpD-Associated n=1 Tax=Pseudooctadecabacter jejudonensis TaxID=1391910 RepID=A0A1Y5S1A8_9RHOB|nr:YdeI/OmpD-associated family protein [Pseudooctadecabacter jejudonensis]SLN29373.1 hypothetical protein PSJ8397_01277 [Pseudooctadecabacter jejudonensis]
MKDYVTFEAAVEPMVWGKATYTILRLPKNVVDALGPTRRVEGEINDHPVNLALTKAPVIDDVFLYAGKSLLRQVGITAGERVEVRLRPAPADDVDVPPDVINAIRSAGITEIWGALTPGKQRGLLYAVNSAKRADTRQRRIAALIIELKGV